MSRTVLLNQSASVRLDGSGNGTAKLGPLSAREVWNPSSVHVSASSAVLDAQCQVFVGDQAIASNFRDSTFTGSSGDSTDRVQGDTIRTGQYVFAVWTGGDVGATATVTVTGGKQV